jgi:hypothetical protein
VLLGPPLERSRGLAAVTPSAVRGAVSLGADATSPSPGEYRRNRARLRRTVELGRDSFAWREVATAAPLASRPLPMSYAGAAAPRGGLIDRYA